MRPDVVLGIARAEARLLRRLVRYWAFLIIAGLAGTFLFLQYSLMHGFLSSLSATVGIIQPKYLVGAFGLNALIIYLIGLIFMSFDVRARDERERVAEVFDTRPFSNLELVVGRWLGILFQSYVPMLLFAAFLQGLGLLGLKMGWPVAGTIETRSLLSFLLLAALPSCALMIALVFLVSLVVRNRLVAALASLTLFGLWIWRLLTSRIDMVLPFDVVGAYTLRFPSEFVEAIFYPEALVQRTGAAFFVAALLGFAAVVHPRLDDGRRKVWAAGSTLLLLAAAGCIAHVVNDVYDTREQAETWRTAHEERLGGTDPDVRAVRGDVTIRPGEEMAVRLTLDVAAPDGTALENLLFTLNPGLAVKSVRRDGSEVPFEHANGLLELRTALAAGETASVELDYAGVPTEFGYLDSAIQFAELSAMEGNLALLGIESALFDGGYAVLMPGVRWLPASGPDVRRDDPDRGPDFFNLDLTVEVPASWTVAGPGRREAAGDGEVGKRYRFAPDALLYDPAIVASEFESRSAEIAGVQLEILLKPQHIGVLDVFDDAGEKIHDWLEEKLTEASELGLDYPYGAFTLVEIPHSIRSYGAGWRMDTTLAPPGMVLLRESGLPTSRFDWRFRKPEDFEDHEGGIAGAKIEALESFFTTDFTGSNVFQGAARSFFSYQTAARGPGSTALNFVCDELVTRLLTGHESFFSAHIFGKEFNANIQRTMMTFSQQRLPGYTFTDAVRETVTDHPEVWEEALSVPLAEMNNLEDPVKAFKVLVLKGTPMSRWLLDGAGREKAGRFLAALRAQTAGRGFTADELFATASENGVEIRELAGDWLETTAMPGFIASAPRFYRLPDEDGQPRYQLAIDLRNDEPAPGLVRLLYTLDDGGDGGRGREPERSEAIRIAAGTSVEVGLVVGKPLKRLWIEPYLALNRDTFAVSLPSLDKEKVRDMEPFSGVRPGDWDPMAGEMILVDDLDEGFSVESEEEKSSFRLSLGGNEEVIDQGLPLMLQPRPPGVWSRQAVSEAFGKYRHTQALIKAGDGKQRAVFTAELPRQGRWRLELFLQPKRERVSERWKRGTYNLTVADAYDDRQELTFDANAAEDGWNSLGELDMPSGEARVILSDETDGGIVIADAIRWAPVGQTKTEESVEETGD